MTTLFAPEFGTHETRAPGLRVGGAEAAGVWLLCTGEAVGLGLVSGAADAVGDVDRAAIEPGDAPTLHAPESTISARSPANRPTQG
jgi:hypothetical protein